MPVNKSTQDFVPIKEIRDGVVVLKDGSMVKVVLASSLNFALKSMDEREAIIIQYQDFLNSLDFTIQLVIQSRKLDIRPYLNSLEEKLSEQETELLKIQTKEYIGFIRSFTESVNIMSKSFFVVVPYSAPVFKGTDDTVSKFIQIFKKSENKQSKAKQESVNFEQSKSQLDQRVNVVVQGLSRVGVRMVVLNTEELVELFYKVFNPGELGQFNK